MLSSRLSLLPFGSFAALCCAALIAAVAAPVRAHAEPARAYVRSEQVYKLPPAKLQRADGPASNLADVLGDGRPVVLTFMFSSCQTVCPITNQVLVELERLLGARRGKVHLVSISIDPDYDSVKQLTAYAKRSGHHGSYFTGDPGASEIVQRAFGSWRGDKTHHEPAFFLSRSAKASDRWVRLSGFVMPEELLRELEAIAPEMGSD